MRVVDFATLKGDGKTNQDRYLIGDYYAAVLDGASAYPPQPVGRDGGWYAEQLAREIERLISPSVSLKGMLAAAIEAVASAHNLVPGDSPSSTIALARWNETDVDCLVLGDSSILVSQIGGDVEHLIDDRLASVATAERDEYGRRLVSGSGYDVKHQSLLAAMQQEQRRRRNSDDGYWIAEAAPSAAQRGLQSMWRVGSISSVVLMTDGARAAVEPMHLLSWDDIPGQLRERGCARLLERTAAAEASDPNGKQHPRSKRHDDKTILVLEP